MPVKKAKVIKKPIEKTKTLRQEIKNLEYKLLNEREMLRFEQGKVETLTEWKVEKETKEAKARNIEFSTMRAERENLEDQVIWLRKLVEKLAMPADKLKILTDSKKDLITTSNQVGFDPRMLENIMDR